MGFFSDLPFLGGGDSEPASSGPVKYAGADRQPMPQERSAAPVDDDGDWFSNTLDATGDILGSVWNWANTDMGLAVIAGTMESIFDDDGKKRSSSGGYGGGGYGGGGGGGPTAADMQDARIKAHNDSINQKMDMGLIKFKK